MPKWLRRLMQLVAYAAFAACIGYFATMPVYHYADPQAASIKLSLSHATEHVKPCVRLTPEEIARLAANMRHTEACERARLPLVLELDIDGERALHVVAQPGGLWNDLPSSVYERLDVAPGEHRIAVRLRDTARTEGWDYTGSADLKLASGRYLTITFKAENGGFHFR